MASNVGLEMVCAIKDIEMCIQIFINHLYQDLNKTATIRNVIFYGDSVILLWNAQNLPVSLLIWCHTVNEGGFISRGNVDIPAGT